MWFVRRWVDRVFGGAGGSGWSPDTRYPRNFVLRQLSCNLPAMMFAKKTRWGPEQRGREPRAVPKPLCIDSYSWKRCRVAGSFVRHSLIRSRVLRMTPITASSRAISRNNRCGFAWVFMSPLPPSCHFWYRRHPRLMSIMPSAFHSFVCFNISCLRLFSIS